MGATRRRISARSIRTGLTKDRATPAILTLDKPKLAGELVRCITGKLNLIQHPKPTPILRELQGQHIIKCLTPSLPRGRPGTVYGLTAKGRALRAHLCEERGLASVYQQPRINWRSYGWVACGRQKKAIVCAMSDEAMRPKEILQEIKKRYRPRTQRAGAEPMGISRQNLNDILQKAIQGEIVIREEEHRKRGKRKPLARYRLSKTGLKIKQLLTDVS